MVELTLEMAAGEGLGHREQDQQCADAGAIVVT